MPNPSRRQTLTRLLQATAALTLPPSLLHQALAANPTEGIRSMNGEVMIDGHRAAPGQAIKLNQKVETGPGARAVYVIGNDAFLQRENSAFVMEEVRGAIVLRYLSGKILSVFGPGRKQLDTPTAAIGIRGTACYIEAAPERSYFCLCYGEALLAPKADPNRRKMLRTRHHEYPVYIDRRAGARAVVPADVANHGDDELVMLEALVGRRPPFAEEGRPRY